MADTNKGLKVALIVLFIIFVVLPAGLCGTILAVKTFGSTVEGKMNEQQEVRSKYESIP